MAERSDVDLLEDLLALENRLISAYEAALRRDAIDVGARARRCATTSGSTRARSRRRSATRGGARRARACPRRS